MATLPASGSAISFGQVNQAFTSYTPGATGNAPAGGQTIKLSGVLGGQTIYHPSDSVISTGTLISLSLTFGGKSYTVNYIEDLFSTYLYTGNASSRTITNGINLSTNGGMVWIKDRTSHSSNSGAHNLFDTVRGATHWLDTSSTYGESISADRLTSFNTTGFSIGTSTVENTNGYNYVSWTFRKKSKFFDVVTWTGNAASLRAISHNLGSTPGCIIMKSSSDLGNWRVYHQSLGISQQVALNDPAAATSSGVLFGSPATAPTSSSFYVGADTESNGSGYVYIAYLFASNAGGFGLTGTDNAITCDTFTTDASGYATVNLGYEPQWILYKRSSGSGNWGIIDNMRGFASNVGGGANGPLIYPGLANTAESTSNNFLSPSSTGFVANGITAVSTFIYVAIRRGPMAIPTSGTSVFSMVARTGTGAAATVTGVGFTPDLIAEFTRNTATSKFWIDRLRGMTQYVNSDTTVAESSGIDWTLTMDGETLPSLTLNSLSTNYMLYHFRRQPGVFDIVCYSGSGTSTPATVTHNLTVAPNMIIMFGRTYSAAGAVQAQVWTSDLTGNKTLYMHSSAALSNWGAQNPTSVTSSTFVSGYFSSTEATSNTFVAYLFATLAGVSKVGQYTGTAELQTINCGFTTGARFVLIKRTDVTGDWYVWDSTRGISSGNDPYTLFNSTAAEVTTTNYIDTDTTGFKVTAAAPIALNANGGTYIFLAIA